MSFSPLNVYVCMRSCLFFFFFWAFSGCIEALKRGVLGEGNGKPSGNTGARMLLMCNESTGNTSRHDMLLDRWLLIFFGYKSAKG
jgi:hypothetical protein